MRKTGWTILTFAVGMLLAAGVPFPTVTSALADPGYGHHVGCGRDCPNHGERCPGCDCKCGYHKGAGKAVPPCMQDNAAAVPGEMPRMMHGGGGPSSMRMGMGKHIEAVRGTILKLRALEAKMDVLKSKDDAAFRAASLEHSRLLTDLQESQLKHMEEMMGAK